MISKYVRRGLPVRDDGLVDLAAAERWFLENVRSPLSGSYRHDEAVRAAKGKGKPAGKPADQTAVSTNGGQGDRAGPGHAVTLVDFQRQKLDIENQRRMLDLLRERAEVVPVRLVNAFLAGMLTKARNELLLLPSRLRDQLGVSDGLACEALLDAELRRILAALCTYPLPEETPNLRPADTAEVPK
jgi:hypothetical protein